MLYYASIADNDSGEFIGAAFVHADADDQAEKAAAALVYADEDARGKRLHIVAIRAPAGREKIAAIGRLMRLDELQAQYGEELRHVFT